MHARGVSTISEASMVRNIKGMHTGDSKRECLQAGGGKKQKQKKQKKRENGGHIRPNIFYCTNELLYIYADLSFSLQRPRRITSKKQPFGGVNAPHALASGVRRPRFGVARDLALPREGALFCLFPLV